MKISQNALVLALLGAPALLFGLASRIRRGLYGLPGAVRRADLPVISVGNLTVGGTGKTTMVAWLVRRLQERGRRPAVVSRGYLGRAGRGPLVVSTGEGPRVEARVSGDEPYLLARGLPGAIVVAGSDRLQGCRAAAEAGADVVVLDDGFQHLRVGRDLDLVLLDAHNPFGNYRLLPAGSLREPASGLSRADLVVITRSRSKESFEVLERVVRRYHREIPILRSAHRCAGFFDPDGNAVDRPSRVVAFCGIGNPENFLTDLEAQGVRVAAFRPFRDHHAFTAEDWKALVGLASAHGASLLTTEKDLVRLTPELRAGAGAELAAMRIEAVVHDAEILLERVDEALRNHRGEPA
jgi:tetraacyldisaccharide 4'-kinase